MTAAVYSDGRSGVQSPRDKEVTDVFLEALFNAVALMFGVVWVWINVYAYFPVVVTALTGGVWRVTSAELPTPSGDDLDEGEEVRDELTDGGTNVSSGGDLTFDVLLPAYHEGEVIKNSIASVREADYDQERINLVVLTEPDDDETRASLSQLERDYEFTVLTVPERYPGEQNKPRALNYGFDRTDGAIVGIIDAENVYSPDVFRAAVEELRGDADFVQARLDMVNESDGWLNTLFRAEYGYWYEVVFPPFFDSGYPIPLGGTTCFFRREVLERASDRRREAYGDPMDEDNWEWIRERGLDGSIAWDPENVTEDFELGLFLWQQGFEPSFVSHPTTDEESPLTLGSWMGQRTRWQKGKLYTLLHYVRYPPTGLSEKLHIYSQTMMPHLGVMNIAAIFVFLAANLYDYGPTTPIRSVLTVGLIWLGVSIGLYAAGYWKASERSLSTRLRRTVIVVLTVPFYWLLNWIADARAFKQTYRGQFHWVKTTHTGRNVLGDDDVVSGAATGRRAAKFTLPRWHRYAALAAITVLAFGTRLRKIGWSLFGDELYTLSMRANQPVSELLFVPHDTHPPLHYLVLHYWMDAFGNSPLSTRFLSVLFSVAAVVAVYALGIQLYDDRAGIVAALLTAVSVFQIHYGQMVRMYSMLAFFTAASWYGFAKLRSDRRVGSAAYLVTTVLLLYTHVYAFFVLAAQNAYVLLAENHGETDRRHWVKLQAAIGIALLPWLSFIVSNLLEADKGSVSLIDWVPLPAAYHLLETLLKFIGYALNYPSVIGVSYSKDIASVLIFVYAICAFLAVVRYRSDEGFELVDIDSGAQLALLIAVPIVVPVVLSYVLFPMFYYRYTIPASIGLYVLVARGITNISSRKVMVAVLCLAVASSGVMLTDYYGNETIEKWDQGIGCLDEETGPGDLVVFQPQWIIDRIDYYDLYSKVDKHYVPKPNNLSNEDVDSLRERVETRDRFWVFRYKPGEEIRSERLLEELRKSHEQVTLMNTTSVDVYRFERDSGGENGTRTTGACSGPSEDDPR